MSDLLNRIDLRREYVEEMLANHIINERGCWLYQGSKKDNGYGKAFLYCHAATPKRRTFSTHRVSYAYYNGVDPGELSVMHTCDDPGCINPSHLELGTHAENMQDMVSKGRSTAGEANPGSKISEVVVLAVVDRIKAGESNVSISKDLPISHAMVSLIRHKKHWIPLLESIGYDPALHRKFKRSA
jgi:hypothetical protein